METQKKVLFLKLDKKLHAFFKEYAESQHSNMTAILTQYIFRLQQEEERKANRYAELQEFDKELRRSDFGIPSS